MRAQENEGDCNYPVKLVSLSINTAEYSLLTGCPFCVLFVLYGVPLHIDRKYRLVFFIIVCHFCFP